MSGAKRRRPTWEADARIGTRLEAALEGQVGEERDFCEGGQRVLEIEDRFGMEAAEGTEVVPRAEAASKDIEQAGWEIGEKPDPGDTWTAAAKFDAASDLINIEQAGEINTGSGTESVVAPGSGVYVEEFELAVARVHLEFDFDETVVIDGAEEALGECFDGGKLDGFDEGAGAAEIVRMLTAPASDHGGDAFAALEEGTVAELIAAVAGYKFLKENLGRGNEASGTAETIPEAGAIPDLPRFGASAVEEVFLDGWFENERKGQIEVIETAKTAGDPSAGNGNVQLSGEIIGFAFVPGELHDFPGGSRDAIGGTQGVPVERESGDLFVASGIEQPTVKMVAMSDIHEGFDGGLSTSEVGDAESESGVA